MTPSARPLNSTSSPQPPRSRGAALRLAVVLGALFVSAWACVGCGDGGGQTTEAFEGFDNDPSDGAANNEVNNSDLTDTGGEPLEDVVEPEMDAAAPDAVTPDAEDTPDGGDEPDLGDFDDGVTDDPSAIDMAEIIDFDHDAVPEVRDLFPLGVAAGAMRAQSVLLWSYSTDTGPWTLRIWRDTDEEGQAALVLSESVTPDADGYFKIPIEGLASGTWYRYGFFLGPEDRGFSGRSSLGRVRTALAPGGLAPLTIGAATCTNFRFQPYRSMLATADEPIDMFVNLGDMSYNDPAETLDEYRGFWARTLQDVGYRAVLEAAGSYLTWDDHEVDNNWNPEIYPAERVAAAKQAFFETLPVERGEADRLWESYQWGDTAEVFVLDGRSERIPSTRLTDDPIYVSRAQMDWLKERLINSTAHFKILLNSVPITRMPPAWLQDNDRWQGYAAQRDELVDFIIDNDIHNVWFLAGDFHVGFVGRVEPEGPGRRIWEVAVGPGGNGPNPLPVLVEAGILENDLVFPEDQFPYGNGMMEVMTTLTFDPIDDSVHIRFVDAITFQVLFDRVLNEND